MKLGVTRERFEDQIRKALYEVGTNRNAQKNVTEELMKKGLYVADDTVFDELNVMLKEKFNTQLSYMQIYNLRKLYQKVIDIKNFD